MTERARGGGWMQTYTGRAFYPLDPRPEDVDILDIAHALAMICRYGGHTICFYSVAEHSVAMSHAVPREHAMWALLHDATEAYMGDMVRPLKRQMPDYAAAEDRLMAVICERFGLPPKPPEVKVVDQRVLVNERAAFLPGPPPYPWVQDEQGLSPLDVTLYGWSPVEAEDHYLRRFTDLGGQIGG